MDELTALLDRARSAGLSVTTDGERLTVRGPKSAAPLAKELLARKLDIIPLLTRGRLIRLADGSRHEVICPSDHRAVVVDGAPGCRSCGAAMLMSSLEVAGDRAWFCEGPTHRQTIPVCWTREVTK